MDEMDLSAALDQFDRTLSNVTRLQKLWQEYEEHIPTGISFGLDTTETDDIRRQFADTVRSLPAINDERLDVELMALDDISQDRFDAGELDFLDAKRSVEDSVYLPERELGKYRYQVIRARRKLIGNHIDNIVARVDNLLRLTCEIEGGRQFLEITDGWSQLRETIAELDRLLGPDMLSETRLGDLNRHLYFAEVHDLRDIVEMDWPNVRPALIELIFDHDPLPVTVDDLGALVDSRPNGPVTSKLEWDRLDSESFERLIFDLLLSADGYENVEWLMKTNAPDRGRDLSATRITVDQLSGTKRASVLLQCKHWLTRSIGVAEIVTLLGEVELWLRPFVVVVVVTSGRFTQDAVQWRETREASGVVPSVEFWPESHLEHLLASRPTIREIYFD